MVVVVQGIIQEKKGGNTMLAVDEKKAEVLNYIGDGYSQKESYKKAGISETTFYKWMNDAEFKQMVHTAQENARVTKADVRGVERALLDIAKGFEYEEVRSEYQSQEVIDEKTGKKEFKPVIKKQTRTKKFVMPNIEAIKFLLTNRDPEHWKNRIDQTQIGNVETNLTITYKGEADFKFPHSEAELELNREGKTDGTDNQG